MTNQRPELPACAAIRYKQIHGIELLGDIIIAGRRHHDCLKSAALAALRKPTPNEQGFMTTWGRFVNRREARVLMNVAGMPSASEGGYRGTTELYSEDLY